MHHRGLFHKKLIHFLAGGSTFTTYTATTQESWAGLACSTDGQIVYATSLGANHDGGLIFKSVDFGATFTVLPNQPFTPKYRWTHQAIAVSWDGMVVSAAGYDQTGSSNSNVYTSLDGGRNLRAYKAVLEDVTWVHWSCLSCCVIVCAGNSWSARGSPTKAGANLYNGLASSKDGSIIVATTQSQSIYMSFDYGATYVAVF